MSEQERGQSWQPAAPASPPPASTAPPQAEAPANPWDTPVAWGQPTGWNAPPAGQYPSGQYPSGEYSADPYAQAPHQALGQRWQPLPQTPVIRPGIVPLRPLSLGEILDGAFQAIRTNPRTMLGVSAVVAAIVALVGLLPNLFYLRAVASFSAAADGTDQEPTMAEVLPMLTSAGGLLVTTLLSSIATAALTAILTLPVGEAVLGRKLDPAGLRRRLTGRIPGVIGVALLSGFVPSMVFGIALLIILLVAFAGSAAGLNLAVVVLLATVLGCIAAVAAIYLAVRWSLAGAAFALEGIGPVAALGRSGTLARGSWWRLFGIQVLVMIMTSIAAQLLGTPLTLAGSLLNLAGGGAWLTSLISSLLVSLSAIVVGALVTPFTAAVLALLYVDRRIRTEGFDVELTRDGGATPA